MVFRLTLPATYPSAARRSSVSASIGRGPCAAPALAVRGLELIERAAEHVEPRRELRRSVAVLVPIGRQVVELRPWRADQLEAPVLNRAQLAPAVVISGIPAFAMRHQPELLAAGERHQVRALHLGRHRDSKQRQGGRHDVDDPHLVGNDRRRHARTADDERDARRGFVDEEAVRQFAVFAEHLAMVGDHDDERVVEAAVGAKRVDQAPDLRVDVRDFGVVGAVSGSWEARLKRSGRFVRGVRVVQVDPGEERAVRLRLQPLERAVDDIGSRPLNHVHRRGVRETGRDRSRRSTDRTPARSPSADRGRSCRRSRRFETPCRAGSRRASADRRQGRSRRCPARRATPGNVPVISDECAGRVRGTTVVACSNRSPDAASASICGVCAAA